MEPFQFKKIILASNSPRRRDLLMSAGFTFQILPADAGVETEYNPEKFKSPADFVLQEARLKVENVARRFPKEDITVLACDTVAVCKGEILGKPTDREDAERMLRLLSDSEHDVISGLCLLNPAFPSNTHQETVVTRLKMDVLTEEMLMTYLDSGKWEGKAGAFGYQDGNDWLHVISGTESNVVGLPLERITELLKPAGGWFHF